MALSSKPDHSDPIFSNLGFLRSDDIRHLQLLAFVHNCQSKLAKVHMFPVFRAKLKNACYHLKYFYKLKTVTPFTADIHQPHTNYVSNRNKYLIIGAVVCLEYSNI